MKRRVLLEGTLVSGAAALAAGTGLLSPRSALAAWPASAFDARNMREALKVALGSDQTIPSSEIEIKAPEIAENGAVVPVTVSTTLPKPEVISLIVEGNPTPLTATFILASHTNGTVATRVKIGKTSNVIAVVRSGGKLYSARKEVKVTIGGCGG